ncbi:MAG: glycosyltransferase, partial [Myxococcales bacterium]|nr:glycosyltransferase [Myxococcales bacterium]
KAKSTTTKAKSTATKAKSDAEGHADSAEARDDTVAQTKPVAIVSEELTGESRSPTASAAEPRARVATTPAASEKAEAPSEKVEAPSEKVEAPSEKVEAPSEKVEAPSTKAKVSTEKAKEPSESAEAPRAKSKGSREESQPENETISEGRADASTAEGESSVDAATGDVSATAAVDRRKRVAVPPSTEDSRGVTESQDQRYRRTRSRRRPSSAESAAVSQSEPVLAASEALVTDPSPGREVESTPSGEVESTPSREVESTPSREVESTPSREVESTPGGEVESTPSREVESTPTDASTYRRTRSRRTAEIERETHVEAIAPSASTDLVTPRSVEDQVAKPMPTGESSGPGREADDASPGATLREELERRLGGATDKKRVVWSSSSASRAQRFGSLDSLFKKSDASSDGAEPSATKPSADETSPTAERSTSKTAPTAEPEATSADSLSAVAASPGTSSEDGALAPVGADRPAPTKAGPAGRDRVRPRVASASTSESSADGARALRTEGASTTSGAEAPDSDGNRKESDSRGREPRREGNRGDRRDHKRRERQGSGANGGPNGEAPRVPDTVPPPLDAEPAAGELDLEEAGGVEQHPDHEKQSRRFRPRFAPRARGVGEGAEAEAMPLSVAVIVERRAPGFAQTLASLRAQRVAGHGEPEIVVIDMGGDDEVRQAIERAGVRRIPVPRGTFALYAYETAMSNTKGEIVVFLDARFEPSGDQWLEALFRPLARDGGAATSSCRVDKDTSPSSRARFDRDSNRGKVAFRAEGFAVRRAAWEGVSFKTYSSLGGWLRRVIGDGYVHLHEPSALLRDAGASGRSDSTPSAEARGDAKAATAQAPEAAASDASTTPKRERSHSRPSTPPRETSPGAAPSTGSAKPRAAIARKSDFVDVWWDATRRDWIEILSDNEPNNGFHPAVRMLLRPAINLVKLFYRKRFGESKSDYRSKFHR